MTAVKQFKMLAAAAMIAVTGLAWGVRADVPVITTESLPNGMAGENYSARIEADIQTVEWSVVSSSLPSGLNYAISPYGCSMYYCYPSYVNISGTPTEEGEYGLTVEADNGGSTATKTFTITITSPPKPAFTYTNPTPDGGQVGEQYYSNNGVARLENGNYTLDKTTGLPPGLEISGGSNWDNELERSVYFVYIFGTPTLSGTYNVRLIATNAGGDSDPATITITIAKPPAPAIDGWYSYGGSEVDPDGELGIDYYKMIRVKGGIVQSHTISGGAIPPGLTMDEGYWSMMSGGYIFNIGGTPTQTGTFNFTLNVENESGSDTKQFTIVITALRKPVIITTELPSGEKGVDYGMGYGVGIYAEGSNITSTNVTGLPSGLNSEGGYISGVPEQAGTFNVTVTATNAAGSDTKTFNLVITELRPPVIITAEQPPSGEKDVGYWHSMYLDVEGSNITGGSVTGLPQGLDYDWYYGGSISISGTPAEAGSFPITVTFTNAAGSGSKNLTLVIIPLRKPVITTASLPACVIGYNYDYDVEIQAEGSNIEWGISGLPSGSPGLQFYDGRISKSCDYIPRDDGEFDDYFCGPTTPGTFPVTVTATNAAGSDTKSFTIVVSATPSAPVITTTSLPNGIVGQNYYESIEAAGYNIEWSVAGDLPPEFSSYPQKSNGNGPISRFDIQGYPTEAGSYTFTVTAKNDAGSVNKSFTVVIAPPITYAATVTDGTGGGNYEAGATVSIAANAAPAGQRFKNWTSTPAVTFANANSATTTFTMPSSAVTVTAVYEIDNTVSISSANRVIPAVKPSEEATVIAPVTVLSGEFTAGPNPVSKQSGIVKFFRQGKHVANGELRIYDAAGNVINKVKISDNKTLNSQSRRPVGSWNLTDRNGRPVSEGTYLVKGVIKTSDGKSEKVSVILGVR